MTSPRSHPSVTIFEHSLVRIGAQPFEELYQLRPAWFADWFSAHEAVERELAAVQEAINEDLYTLAPTVSAEIRGPLLRIKRDVFNRRTLSPERVASILPSLPPATQRRLRMALDLTETQQRSFTKARQRLAEDLPRCRRALREFMQNGFLRSGLLLSSRSLLQGVRQYEKQDLRKPNKKGIQTEQGILKYLTRMHAKVSPFSSFTHLLLARWTDRPDWNGELLDDAAQGVPTECSVRLNNGIFAYLSGIVLQHPEARPRCPVRANATLRQENDEYFFLTNSQNREAFQRMPFHPVADAVVQWLGSGSQAVVEIVRYLSALDGLDASPEQLTAFVDQLLEYGLLEFDLGISARDPDWDEKWIQKLTPWADDVDDVARLVKMLRSLQGSARRFARSTEADRLAILQRAFEEFRDTAFFLHERAGLPAHERTLSSSRSPRPSGTDSGATDPAFRQTIPSRFDFRIERLFYEDSTVTTSARLPRERFRPVIEKLHGLMQELRLFEMDQLKKVQSLRYFVERYGPGSTVPLLDFYEEYYRDVKLGEEEYVQHRTRLAQLAERKLAMQGSTVEGDESERRQVREEQRRREKRHDELGRKIAPHLAAERSLQDRQSEWLRRFVAQIPAATLGGEETIFLSHSQVACINQERGNSVTRDQSNVSYSAFLQFIEPGDGTPPTAVFNGAFPGFGKLLSRFLHLFPDGVTERLLQENEDAGTEVAFLAENHDGSVFNANIHPPLMPFEIRMPGGHCSLPREQQLAVNELDVRHEEKTGELVLLHRPSGRRVYVFDLGFQGDAGRSPMFQLLQTFTLAEQLPPGRIANAIFDETRRLSKERRAGQPGITVYPRIVYEDQIVLRRKSWQVPKSLLPDVSRTGSELDVLYAINHWREELGIPSEVFVTLFPRYLMNELTPEQLRTAGPDGYKPQYVDFSNPFLVQLFHRSIPKVPYVMTLVEMLPRPCELLKCAGKGYVTEAVVQWRESTAHHSVAFAP